MNKAEVEPNAEPRSQLGEAGRKKLQVIQQLAEEILLRIEQLLHQDPAVVLAKKTGVIPREIEDTQDYFLQKVRRIRKSLTELREQFEQHSEPLDRRELIRVELMVLMVLVESYRPERITEAGLKLDEQAREVISERIESLALDILNMRERLK